MSEQRQPYTRAEYDAMSPYAQGYVSYCQAAWNKDVPECCPHPADSPQQRDWNEGQHDACLDVQDEDDA